MESVTHITCQWHQCRTQAEKHAVFGQRVFAAKLANISDDDAFSIARHRDVCGHHLAELRRQYVDVLSMEIGSCADHG